MVTDREIRALQAKKLQLEIDRLEAGAAFDWDGLTRFQQEEACAEPSSTSHLKLEDEAMRRQEREVWLARARGRSSL